MLNKYWLNLTAETYSIPNYSFGIDFCCLRNIVHATSLPYK